MRKAILFFYFDGASPVEVNFNLAPGGYSAEWSNVSTGETTMRQKLRHRDREKHREGPTFEQGIALRLNEP
jgi:hypothetical protein